MNTKYEVEIIINSISNKGTMEITKNSFILEVNDKVKEIDYSSVAQLFLNENDAIIIHLNNNTVINLKLDNYLECFHLLKQNKSNLSNIESVNQIGEIHSNIFNEQGIVTIHGYKEWYIHSPKVKIYDNDVLLYEIRKDEIWKHRFEKDTILTFKTLGKIAQIEIKVGENKKIFLSLDRFTGSLIATSNSNDFSQSKSIIKNYTNEEYKELVLNNASDRRKYKIVPIILILVVIFSFVYILNTPEDSADRATEIIVDNPYKIFRDAGQATTPVKCTSINNNKTYHCTFSVYNDSFKTWVDFKYLVELDGYSWHYEEIK